MKTWPYGLLIVANERIYVQKPSSAWARNIPYRSFPCAHIFRIDGNGSIRSCKCCNLPLFALLLVRSSLVPPLQSFSSLLCFCFVCACVRICRVERSFVAAFIFCCSSPNSRRYCAILRVRFRSRAGSLRDLDLLCVTAGVGVSAGGVSLPLSILLHISGCHVLIIQADHSNDPEARY